MSLLREYLRRPRKVWLRRLSFQIHLWVGLILTLYLIMIGLTGSILVFREELENLAGLNPWRNLQTSGRPADPVEVIANVRAAFPQARLISLQAPTASNPVYVAVMQGRGRNFGMGSIAIHPVTAQVLGRMPRRLPPNWAWLGFVRNLHATLLLGIKGREVNGALAGALLLINLTGIVIWWPGLKLWRARSHRRLCPRLAARQLRSASRRWDSGRSRSFRSGESQVSILDGRARHGAWWIGSHRWFRQFRQPSQSKRENRRSRTSM